MSNTQFISVDVDRFNQIPEMDEFNNVTRRNLPDLTPTRAWVVGTYWGKVLGLGPNSPAAGIPAPVYVNAANLGQMPPTGYRIRWRVRAPDPVSGIFDDVAGSPIFPMTLYTQTGQIFLGNFTFPAAGIHDICVRLDADNVNNWGNVPEMNDPNNNVICAAPFTVHDPLPELTVWSGGKRLSTDITAPSWVYVGATANISAFVRNYGEAPTANPFDVVMEDLTEPGTVAPSNPISQAVAAPFTIGQRQNFTYTWTPTQPGRHTLRFKADLDLNLPAPLNHVGTVDEIIDEVNNNWVERIVDVRPLPRVDLAPTSCAPDRCVEAGQAFGLVCRVFNSGGFSAASAQVNFTSATAVPVTIASELKGVNAGAAATFGTVVTGGVNNTMTINAAGSHQMTATVTTLNPAGGANAETNLTNNTLTFSVNVKNAFDCAGRVDLDVTSCTTTCHEVGDQITDFTCGVKNVGGAAAAQAHVTFYDGAVTPTSPAIPVPNLVSNDILNLAAGGLTAVSMDPTLSTPLTYATTGWKTATAYVWTDLPAAGAAGSETNMANNIAPVSFNIKAAGGCSTIITPPPPPPPSQPKPDIYVWSEHIHFNPDVTQTFAGDVINVTADLWNRGAGSADNVHVEIIDKLGTYNSVTKSFTPIVETLLYEETLSIPANLTHDSGLPGVRFPSLAALPGGYVYTVPPPDNPAVTRVIEVRMTHVSPGPGISPQTDIAPLDNAATKGLLVGELDYNLKVDITQPDSSVAPPEIMAGRPQRIIVKILDLANEAVHPVELTLFNLGFTDNVTGAALPSPINVLTSFGSMVATYPGDGVYYIDWIPDASMIGTCVDITATAIDLNHAGGSDIETVCVHGVNLVFDTPNPATLPADGTSKTTLRAKLVDAVAVPEKVLYGEKIKFEVRTGDGSCTTSISPMEKTIAPDGWAKVVFTACQTTGVNTVTASSVTVAGVADQTQTVTLTPGPMALVVFAPVMVTLPADGTSSQMIQATVTDTTGAGVAGAVVTFTNISTIDGTMVGGPTCTTGVGGTCSVTYRAGGVVGAGKFRVSAAMGTATLNAPMLLKVSQTALPPANISIWMSSLNTSPAGPPIGFTVTVTDSNSWPVSGQYVSAALSVPACGAVAFAPPGGTPYPTNSAGQVSGTFTPTDGACNTNITFCVTGAGVCGAVTAGVTVGAGGLVVIGTPISVASISFKIEATVLDAAGQPVGAGTAVEFDSGGVGAFTPPTALTDTDGKVATTFKTRREDGDVDVRVVVPSIGGIEQILPIHFTALSPDGVAYVAYTGNLATFVNIGEVTTPPLPVLNATANSGLRRISDVYWVTPTTFLHPFPPGVVIGYSDNPAAEADYEIHWFNETTESWEKMATFNNNTTTNEIMGVVENYGFFVVLGRDTAPPEISNIVPLDGSASTNWYPLITADVRDDDGGSGIGSVKVYMDTAELTDVYYDEAAGKVYAYPSGQLSEGAHTLRIEARDRAGNSAAGVSVFVVYSPLNPPPAAPTNFRHEKVGASDFLRWDAPITNADGTELTDLAGYNLYEETSPGMFNLLNTGGLIPYTEYDITSLLADNRTHTFVVAAVDGDGSQSAYSDAVSFSITIAPPPCPVLSTIAGKDWTSGSATSNDPLPAITGVAEPGSHVKIYLKPVTIDPAEAVAMYANNTGTDYTISAPQMKVDGVDYTDPGKALLVTNDGGWRIFDLNPPAENITKVTGAKDIWVFLVSVNDFPSPGNVMQGTLYAMGDPGSSQNDQLEFVKEFLNTVPGGGYSIDAYGPAFKANGEGADYTPVSPINAYTPSSCSRIVVTPDIEWNGAAYVAPPTAMAFGGADYSMVIWAPEDIANGTPIFVSEPTAIPYLVNYTNETIDAVLIHMGPDPGDPTATAYVLHSMLSQVPVPPDAIILGAFLPPAAPGAPFTWNQAAVDAAGATVLPKEVCGGDTPIAEANAAPLTGVFTSPVTQSLSPDGVKTIYAIAETNYGRSESCPNYVYALDTAAPSTCRFIEPEDGDALSGVEKELVVEADDENSISKVNLFHETAPLGEATPLGNNLYSLNWNFADEEKGFHRLSSVCADAAGNTSAAAITVKLPSADVPIVNISSPLDGATVYNTFPVTVEFFMDGDEVHTVELHEDTTLLGSEPVHAAAGARTFTVTLPNGNHRLTAKAYRGDPVNGIAGSDTVEVVAADVIPALEITGVYNYPEPFDTVRGTTVYAALTVTADVAMEVYDTSGARLLRTLAPLRNGLLYSAFWDGADGYGRPVDPGDYVVKVTAVSGAETARKTLVITVESGGPCVPACNADADCDDGNALTTDTCDNGGTCSASCSHVACSTACSFDTDCNDGNPTTIDACNNPGTCSASCSNTPCAVVCGSDADCDDGNPATLDTCSAPGTCGAVCLNNPCSTVACYSNADCNDSDPNTVDTCDNPGTCAASCSHAACDINSPTPGSLTYGGPVYITDSFNDNNWSDKWEQNTLNVCSTGPTEQTVAGDNFITLGTQDGNRCNMNSMFRGGYPGDSIMVEYDFRITSFTPGVQGGIFIDIGTSNANMGISWGDDNYAYVTYGNTTSRTTIPFPSSGAGHIRMVYNPAPINAIIGSFTDSGSGTTTDFTTAIPNDNLPIERMGFGVGSGVSEFRNFNTTINKGNFRASATALNNGSTTYGSLFMGGPETGGIYLFYNGAFQPVGVDGTAVLADGVRNVNAALVTINPVGLRSTLYTTLSPAEIPGILPSPFNVVIDCFKSGIFQAASPTTDYIWSP